LAALVSPLTAHAGTEAILDSLVEELHAKGILGEEKYQTLRQDIREARREQTMQEKIVGDERDKARKTQLTGEFKDRFGFATADGEQTIRLTGRLNADYRKVDNGFSLTEAAANDRDSASIANGFELRRARLGVTGSVFRDVSFQIDANAIGNAPTVDQAWVNLGWYRPVQFRVGRFKQPISLEQQASSNDIDFAERSYIDQFTPNAGKRLGAMLHGEPLKGMTYAGSVYQEGFGEESQADGEGMRHAGRVTGNIAELASIPDTVLHLGAAMVGGDYQLRPTTSTNTDATASAATRATVLGFRTLNRGLGNIFRAQLGGQDTLAAGYGLTSEFGVDIHQRIHNLEMAMAHGAYKLQGEYAIARYGASNPLGGQSVRGDVRAWYVQALWNITGESWAEAYKGGRFGPLKLRDPYRPGGAWGGWQLGVRYSGYDASDLRAAGANSRIQSGGLAATDNSQVHSWGVGLNWMPNTMTRVMLEWTRTDLGGETVPLDLGAVAGQGIRKEDVVSVRSEFKF
jgi:phosphate-selective porin OprO/OprP